MSLLRIIGVLTGLVVLAIAASFIAVALYFYNLNNPSDRWLNPDAEEARRWLSMRLNHDISDRVAVIASARSPVSFHGDYSACVLVEIDGDYSVLLGNPALPNARESVGVSCPDNFVWPEGMVRFDRFGCRQLWLKHDEFLTFCTSRDERYVLVKYSLS